MYLAKYSQQTKNRRKLKGIYDKPTANIMLNGVRLNLALFIEHGSGGPK